MSTSNRHSNQFEVKKRLHVPCTSQSRCIDRDFQTPPMLPMDSNNTQVATHRESIGNIKRMFARNKSKSFDNLTHQPSFEEAKVVHKNTFRSLNARTSVNSLAKSTPLIQQQVYKTPIKTADCSKRTNYLDDKIVPKYSPESSKRRYSQQTTEWEAPCLYEAYPQALKYSFLPASTLSAETILRTSSYRQGNKPSQDLLEQRSDQRHLNQASIQAESLVRKRIVNTKSLHKRKSTRVLEKLEWTRKIYVLVPSGYLLQYSGAGPVDRVPEKIMKLEKDSVAFASDVIPGKHWVLQVSNALNSDGTSADTRSLLSRLTQRGSEYKKIATSFLLVLDSAEELVSWITVLRKEINTLGEAIQISEKSKCYYEKPLPPLELPRRRVLIHRNSDLSPEAQRLDMISPKPNSNTADKRRMEGRPRSVCSSKSGRHSPLAFRPSTGDCSTPNSFISHDGRRLQSLSGSQHRSSYTSSGQRTLLTSPGSSPCSSPNIDSCDSCHSQISAKDSNSKPLWAGLAEVRKSTTSVKYTEHEQDYFNFNRTSGPSPGILPHRSTLTINYSHQSSSIKESSTFASHTVKSTRKLTDPSTKPQSNSSHIIHLHCPKTSSQITDFQPTNRNSRRTSQQGPIHRIIPPTRESGDATTLFQNTLGPSSETTAKTAQVGSKYSGPRVRESPEGSRRRGDRGRTRRENINGEPRVELESAFPFKLSHGSRRSRLQVESRCLYKAQLTYDDDEDFITVKPSRRASISRAIDAPKMRRVSSDDGPLTTLSYAHHIAHQLASQCHWRPSKCAHSSSSYYVKPGSYCSRDTTSPEVPRATARPRRSLLNILQSSPPMPPPSCALPPLPTVGRRGRAAEPGGNGWEGGRAAAGG
ncbi:BgTH12-04102 [Blumeria graminis f. sp. triticale]|uniref:BgTH12-04102 n=1 Tax=Blumeria graminis f. sp. triticale TaxID=1689686 RepID=A0A9W4D122_BLUGR|nr:BgTH12-04102 [Blumeria graminis f. sp. triticale]